MPFALGRKNWRFSASVDGAKASANLYGLIEIADPNGLEPYHYLRKVFNPGIAPVAGVLGEQ